MKQTTLPFQIAIGPRTTGHTYPVRATFDGAETHADLALPDYMLDYAVRLPRPGVTLPLGDPGLLGRTLGRALFAPPLRELLLQSAKTVARGGGRLQLQLQIGPPELAALPWELVTVGLNKPWSPALRDDYALVRVSRGAPAVPPVAVAGPLCVLAAGAPGEELQIEALESALGEAARAGRIKLRVVRDVTPATLERALMEGPVHILHVAAPVALTERRAARLLLRRGADMFDLSELVAGQRDLRLVTLTGPQGDAASIGATLPALAATLLTADLPATIAFGGPLPARQSARFAAVCYGQLASGAPIDLAVTTARRALAESAGGRGWGLAQLRLAPGGEQIFALRGRPRRAPVRLPRPALVAGASVALIAAFLLGSRAIGARHPAATAAQALAPTSAITTMAQALAPSGAGAPTALPTVTVEATETPKSSGGVLAALFGAPSTPTAIPEPTTPPAPTAASAPASYAAFLTGPNDTPESIAQRMGSDAAAIAALNHLDSHAPLRTERPLVIPVYRPGEPGNGGLVIARGNPAERKVALTFDIEIDATTLYGFLDVLRARGIHGTFFVTGRWVQAFPDAARAIVKDGHEIGNHSLTHPFFSRIGLDGVAAELQETEQVVQETTGATTRPYFRYPYGDYTADTTAVVASQGFVAYHWSADDDAISGWLDRVAQNPAAGNGAILLMHGRAESVAALPGWLDRLAAVGLQPTTLGDTLR